MESRTRPQRRRITGMQKPCTFQLYFHFRTMALNLVTCYQSRSLLHAANHDPCQDRRKQLNVFLRHSEFIIGRQLNSFPRLLFKPFFHYPRKCSRYRAISAMASQPDLATFLRKRQDLLTPQFEAGDVNKILTFYDPKLSFSDHGRIPPVSSCIPIFISLCFP